jgi:YebC/PmpR family DNA-binding regulatory protein
MSGHSKWASIKHKKAATDKKRGQLFTKIIKEITVAARASGGNEDQNPRLRVAIEKAKEANMPSDNIARAIKKGTGELPGVSYEEISLEAYGPSGVAIYMETLTDNKNRTLSEVRSIFTKKGGNLAQSGAVSWLFEKKGFFLVSKKDSEEDKLMNAVLEAGAEDMSAADDVYEIKSAPQDFDQVKKSLQDAGIKLESSEITMLPKSSVKITDEHTAKQVLNLIEALEDHDDIQNVYANFDIPDDLIGEE